MVQFMEENMILPANFQYQDTEFSDTEVEALMEYFRMPTYEDLKSLLAGMKNSSVAKGSQ
jgi:hypothetical protein